MSGKRLKDQIEVAGSVSEEKTTLNKRIKKTTTRRKSYVMDLRIQSPAALGYIGIDGIDTAPALVRLAKVKGIDVIAVTDFYGADIVDRVLEEAENSTVTVLPGVIIRCSVAGCNDVIMTVLFSEESAGNDIRNFLTELGVPPSAAGNGDYIVKAEFEELLQIIERYQALAIPSRMDRTPYRKMALKVLVEDYGFRAFDLAYFPESLTFFKENWPKIKFELMSFSNATSLAQVGSRSSKIKMATPGFSGLKNLTERVAEL